MFDKARDFGGQYDQIKRELDTVFDSLERLADYHEDDLDSAKFDADERIANLEADREEQEKTILALEEEVEHLRSIIVEISGEF